MLVSTTKCMWWPWWAYSEVQWPYRAFASNTMTVSVVNKIRSTHQMQSPSVSSTKYGDVSWARYRCTIVYAYFLSGRLRVWCGGHIISSCGGSTWRLMGRFHPAPHIGWTETCYTKTHVEDSAYNTKLPESRRTLSPLVISRLYMICNPRPPVCYRSLGASSSIVYTHAQCLVFTCTLYTPLSLIYSTRSRLFLQLQGSDPN